MARVRTVRVGIVTVVAAATAVGVAVGPQLAAAAPSSPRASTASTATPTLGPGGRVIVLLKNHDTQYNAKTSAARARARAARGTVDSVARHIRAAGGSVSRSYTLINALAAKVTAKEAAALAANADVQEVVPDQMIKRTSPTAVAKAAATAGKPGIAPPAGTCLPKGKVKLEPQALETTRADSDVPGAKTARSLGYTGKGVTVAYIAEGIDPNNPDFIRDGKSIFTDVQDFSGEGPNMPTGGGESFLDASAIAAQGNEVYNVSRFSKLHLNKPCNIRIEGESPGVNLVGLNIFGEGDTGFNSSFIQAIQYAATVDHVNILNESLGGNPYPDDNGSLDAVKAANDAAVAAGVTVTASSGDAGITNTIGSPATDPNVISVGASTTYQFFLATGYGGARLPGITGWVDNNISSLSSGGTDQDGRTVNLVAPGELNYAVCSKDLTNFFDCADYAGNPLGVEASGGTSEAAPIVAGVSALVIEAYRDGHGGASPTPAQIKNIVVSTADDIRAPGDQQGAGLVDAYKAVQLAKSYQGGEPTGDTITSSANQLNSITTPGSTPSFTDTVTNSGTSTQTVSASARTLGAYSTIKTASVRLNDNRSPKYTDFQGILDNYEKVTFTVPAGVDRLRASIAYQGASTALSARVRLTLVDPDGRLAGYSLPQGIGNFGNSEVADPTPGTWIAYIQSRTSAGGGTQGKVLFSAETANYKSFGTVSPSTLTLAPGASGAVTLTAPADKVPGDVAGSLLLTTSVHEDTIPATTTVPVTIRSLIPTGGYTFKDTLRGGNGRGGTTGQEAFYNIDVSRGLPELNAYISLADNPNNQFYAQLVSPTGNALATASNNVYTTTAGGTPKAINTLSSQLHVLTPQAGRWTLIVVFSPRVSGEAISQGFTVSTNQLAVPSSAKGLPNSSSTVIPAGATKTVYVKIKNTGTSPAAYFIDARRSFSKVYALAPLFGDTTTEPLTSASNTLAWAVPTETTAMLGTASTDGPDDIQADMGYNVGFGDPDLESGTGKTVTAFYQAPKIAQGVWDLTPTEVGPYSAPGATETVTGQMAVLTKKFDDAVSSATGDLWLQSVDPSAPFAPVLVNPGQTVSIPVTITASGSARAVTGTLYVDDLQQFSIINNLGAAGFPNGNEVAALPYSYTIK